MRSAGWLAAVVGCACALVLVAAALAFWAAPGSGGSTGVVSQLTAPSPSATSPVYGSAHVAWSAVTLDPPVPSVDTEVTYTVERRPSTDSTWIFVCGTGTTPEAYDVLACDDTPPAADTYEYRVTGRFRTWTTNPWTLADPAGNGMLGTARVQSGAPKQNF